MKDNRTRALVVVLILLAAAVAVMAVREGFSGPRSPYRPTTQVSCDDAFEHLWAARALGREPVRAAVDKWEECSR